MGILISIFLALVIYNILKTHVSSVAFLVSLLTLFLYIIPFYTLWNTFEEMGFIAPEYAFRFFLYVFLCYLGFFLGHWLCLSKSKQVSLVYSSAKMVFDNRKYEQYSILVGIIGILGYGYFIYKSGPYYFYGHNSGDFSVGGYVYELRYFIFSAVLLLFNGFLDRRISKKGLFFLVAITLFLLFDAYIQQQRGSWIRFGVILIFSYLFAQKGQEHLKLPQLYKRYKIIFLMGILLGFVLTLTVQIRKFYSPDTTFSQQISLTVNRILENPDLLFGGSGIDEGNEFVTAYNAFQANEMAGTYDFGLKWLYPFINFVPRQKWTSFIPRNLWEEKPTWFDFSTNVFVVMQRYSKTPPANGSAETGFIDTFYRFFWAAPFFFVLFGYYLRRLHAQAVFDIRKRMFYICLYVGCFYFFTQNMLPLVIFTLYMYIPIWYINKRCCLKMASKDA